MLLSSPKAGCHLALPSGDFQLAVAFRVVLLLTPRQHVLRGDGAGGTVQADAY